jgi:hypothetical protein
MKNRRATARPRLALPTVDQALSVSRLDGSQTSKFFLSAAIDFGLLLVLKALDVGP